MRTSISRWFPTVSSRSSTFIIKGCGSATSAFLARTCSSPAQGDGLTIAYHGLNLGRVALCATAAGAMRVMLANMLPWAKFRRTYGAEIVSRELVRRRIGRLAALIVGCDALVAWCSWLIDQGYRGELECIVAKIFGSEAQKEAAIELFMKTHGGRAFLQGHLFGENIHEYLAPCIYEGEGEMLGMAFFKSLIKEHGKTFFEPIGRALQAAGIRKPNPLNPAHAWALRDAIGPYLAWRAGQTFAIESSSPTGRRCPRTSPPMPSSPRTSLAPRPARDQRRDVQAPASAGRPPVPDGRALATNPGPGVDAGDQSVGRAAVERSRADRGRHPLPGPDPATDRPPADRRLFSCRHQAGRDGRLGRVRGDRGNRARRNPDAVRPLIE